MDGTSSAKAEAMASSAFGLKGDGVSANSISRLSQLLPQNDVWFLTFC